MPRPSKLTPDTHKAIVQAIEAGSYADAAAAYAGINPATYYRWMARGRDEHDQLDTIETRLQEIGTKPRNRTLRAERTRLLKQRKTLNADPQYREFCEAVARAGARAEVGAVAAIKAAMRDDWRAALAYLERRYPERWRRRESHEHVGPPGEGSETPGPIQIVAGVGPPELTQAAHDLLRVAREQRGGPAVDAGD